MRHLVLVAAVALAAGCTRDYLVTQRTADALRALPPAQLDDAAVAATADDAPVTVRASRLQLVPGSAPAGRVLARPRYQARNRGLAIAGGVVLGVGVVLVIAGAAVAAQPTNCAGEDFCGFGQAIEAVTIMGFGGGVGLVGIPLIAVGASSRSPELAAGAPGFVYLPR